MVAVTIEDLFRRGTQTLLEDLLVLNLGIRMARTNRDHMQRTLTGTARHQP
jgi:hypothetical protein